MEICREKELIILKENEVIEEYSLSSEVNFKKLINYLLNLNLSKKITIKNKIGDMNDAEENLVKLVNKIIDDYNEKVDELERFKKENWLYRKLVFLKSRVIY